MQTCPILASPVTIYYLLLAIITLVMTASG